MSGFSNSLLSGSVSQMAYVTNDFDQACAIFATQYGIPRFHIMKDYDIALGGRRVARAHIALALLGETQIEIIAPKGGDDEIYRVGIGHASGFALHFHHEARKLSSFEAFYGMKRLVTDHQLRIVIDAEILDGGACYFYTDNRATLGHFVEYCFYSPELESAASAPLPRY